jgi:hypothetical protein
MFARRTVWTCRPIGVGTTTVLHAWNDRRIRMLGILAANLCGPRFRSLHAFNWWNYVASNRIIIEGWIGSGRCLLKALFGMCLQRQSNDDCHDIRSSDRDLNLVPSEYKALVLSTTHPVSWFRYDVQLYRSNSEIDQSSVYLKEEGHYGKIIGAL